MEDLLGMLQAPSGEKIKIVVAAPGALPDQRVAAFPTLTKNIIVAINRDLLMQVVEQELGDRDEDECDEDDVNEVMMHFVPEIVLAATKVIDADVNANPFGFEGDA